MQYNTGPGTANDVTTTLSQDGSTNLIPRPKRIQSLRGGQSLFDTGTFTYDGAGNVLSVGSDTFSYPRRDNQRE